MFNRLYNYLEKSNILYHKQFGFRKNHSTEHAVIDLANQILQGFENNCYTLEIFLDLSKAFDTVNHKILIYKLRNYGVVHSNLKWLQCYLENRKQGVPYDLTCSPFESISCGVPQGSILGPLLFLVYINDIFLSSKILNYTIFADDTNVFFSDSNLKNIFYYVNAELIYLNEWFIANKLSLNIEKTYILFAKPSKSENLPLKLPELTINNIKIKRVFSMKILGINFDEHLNWKSQIKLVENKVSKTMGIMYRTKHLLNKICLKNLYFSFIHSHINYCNIAWANNHSSFLKNIYTKQKQASRLVLGADRYESAKPLLKEINALNVYELNIYHNLLFMFKLQNELIPKYFYKSFSLINHKYETRHSINNYYIPPTSLKKSDFSITCRGPRLWKSVLDENMKKIKSIDIFKRTIKKHLLNSNITYILSFF